MYQYKLLYPYKLPKPYCFFRPAPTKAYHFAMSATTARTLMCAYALPRREPQSEPVIARVRQERRPEQPFRLMMAMIGW